MQSVEVAKRIWPPLSNAVDDEGEIIGEILVGHPLVQVRIKNVPGEVGSCRATPYEPFIADYAEAAWDCVVIPLNIPIDQAPKDLRLALFRRGIGQEHVIQVDILERFCCVVVILICSCWSSAPAGPPVLVVAEWLLDDPMAASGRVANSFEAFRKSERGTRKYAGHERPLFERETSPLILRIG
ncbi:hypothetical protein N658DRAFT_219615 [Parathielavia hyrcaniae]|uniref:Uncharacterized protein n=1 Tax=Parathielavia hyrcaniae TaxID=113614 RepID=A0AAN6PZW0_9PEZI|nr:hypothetical protein N658DRAFT_219615 [Parathielavia hyrcaniae]